MAALSGRRTRERGVHPGDETQKPSNDHWSSVEIGSSEHRISFLLYSSENKIGLEVYVPGNKEIGQEIIGYKAEFEKILGVEGTIIDAAKASGIRFFRGGWNFKKNTDRWDEMITWQLNAAVKLRSEILKLAL